MHDIKEHTGSTPKAGTSPNMFIARCGAESSKGDDMTAWRSEVTCEACMETYRG